MAAPMVATLAGPGNAHAADPAPHASTAAERQARGEEAARNFVQGRYEEALATYLDLYIQSDARPEYLRNIGRCQQKLKQYPRAIESFKDYLRRAKHLGADEKKEVQGFISEMESAMAGGATPAPAAGNSASIKPAPPATTPPSAPAPVFAPAPRPGPAPQPYLAPAPPPPSQPWPSPAPSPAPAYGQQPGGASAPNGAVAYNGGAQPSLAAPAPAPGPPDLVTRAPEPNAGSPSHMSPLRIAGIASAVLAAAGAIGGTIELLRARSVFNEASGAGCPGANSKSYCGGKADAVDSANTVSKILYIGAGVLGVAGITMIVAAPTPTPDGRVSLAVTGRF